MFKIKFFIPYLVGLVLITIVSLNHFYPVKHTTYLLKESSSINSNYKNNNSIGSLSGNMVNGIDFNNSIVINNGFLYKTERIKNKNYLLKIDLNTSEETILLDDILAKNFICIDNKLFFVSIQNVDNKKLEVLTSFDISNNELKTYDNVRFDNINSFVYDGINIFITNKSDKKIYSFNLNDNLEVFYNDLDANGFIYLLGINDGYLYFTNGKSLNRYNFTNENKEILNYDIISQNQKPILSKDGVIAFSDFGNNILSSYYLNGDYDKTISNDKIGKINSFNMIGNILFVNINNKILYKSINDENFLEIKDLIVDNSPFFLDLSNIIYKHKGKFSQYNISWILSN